ncbi:MAG: choice-of-anchor tandem repeat GloVer-containing protein [Terriglobales bacterium]|jgi:hypothetical protein
MHTNRNVNMERRQGRVLIATIVVSIVLLAAQAARAKEVVIANLTGGNPESVLIADSNGVLYGTFAGGGFETGIGSVFSLTPPAPGQSNWTETILYHFLGGNDGNSPLAGLTSDGSGGFFGTTVYGGGGPCENPSAPPGCGTVFHLSPPGQGQTNWTETVLYRFQGPDGALPFGRITLDSATGVLYSTCYLGGASNAGTVFALTPPSQGQTDWTESVLYSFTGAADGGYPFGYLLADSTGALYATTNAGGFTGNGTVFKLTPPSQGQTNWTESVLYSFLGWAYGDGGSPSAGLIFDASGNIYGSTAAGGLRDYGTIFELSPPSGGGTDWTETVLYVFGGGKDGALPAADLVMDAKGAIYSTTAAGGSSNNGTVFKLTPPGSGETAWTEKRLTTFNGSDGSYSDSGLLPLKVGKAVVLFGGTLFGGGDGVGVIYEITGSGFAE